MDAETAREQWKFKTGSEITSSPAIADGTIYFGSGFMLFALNMEGERIWNFNGGHLMNSSPAVVDGLVYFGNTDGLYVVQ